MITSKIKHAIKHKTSPARLAQLLRNCCSPHWHFVGRYAVIGCKLKQNANEGRNSCASLAGLVLFYCMFYFTCDRSLRALGLNLYHNYDFVKLKLKTCKLQATIGAYVQQATAVKVKSCK